jgi:hypothetical protein
MIALAKLNDPTVRELVNAINTGNRDAFFACMAPDATMSDDGTDRDLSIWADQEIFTSDGRMQVESQSVDGRKLEAQFTNLTWGQLRTEWRFHIADGVITRFETSQE